MLQQDSKLFDSTDDRLRTPGDQVEIVPVDRCTLLVRP